MFYDSTRKRWLLKRDNRMDRFDCIYFIYHGNLPTSEASVDCNPIPAPLSRSWTLLWNIYILRGILWNRTFIYTVFIYITFLIVCCFYFNIFGKQFAPGTNFIEKWESNCCLALIRVITKLPNSEQSYKGKVKTRKYISRQNHSTTGKLWKPQWPWLDTGIFAIISWREQVVWSWCTRLKRLQFDVCSA